MTLDDYEVILHFIKKIRLHNVDILKKFQKDWELNKKYIGETDDFEILSRPYVTFNDL